MQAALAQVKQELGPQAVILNTKTFYQGGFLGLRKKEIVEILASREVNIVDTPPSFARQKETYARHHISGRSPLVESKSPPPGEGKADEILKELSSLKSRVELLTREYVRDPDCPPALSERYELLLKAGVSKLLAKKIVGAVHTDLNKADLENASTVEKSLAQEIGKLMKLSGPVKCDGGKTRKVVMTGPTGVGKTTTIAKLAAHFSIKERRRVGLITADTYRIAAVEQLKVYADIIGVALDVVLTPKELREAVKRHSDKEIIFIDTAGRSQQNRMKLVELKNFVESAEPDENHLLISTTTSEDEIFNIIDKFSIVDVSSFIFSKTDECTKPGLILDVLASSEKPVSYLTTGQDVPDDIEVATEESLLNLLFKDCAQ
ncbi:MAG: flagellar biosynthesis protein FlhF [Candidatus Abyssobacteria bacterium SURF_17]|uniref:Flagellar biosynthesis protein FlhF n=1 Tax=Candidatus Abyssobacteria bacterium SURF_17 TaxID=2093361 RepID=A0A419EY26_9BACT|nr:MAG: flagellar biosynthesis protein FlhF [Candidatus Abyssubacteria bacterium SURF_17]